MIKMEEVTAGAIGHTCACCFLGAEFKLTYGLGSWPVSVTNISLCKECANDLLEQLNLTIADGIINSVRSRGVIPDHEIYEEEDIEEEDVDINDIVDPSVATPSSDEMKTTKCS